MANKPFSIRLAGGEPDEDLYRYAGRHHDEQDAIRAARKEMDRAYNENYRDALDDQFRRGIDVGQQTTQYRVVTIVEDVNEYAATPEGGHTATPIVIWLSI